MGIFDNLVQPELLTLLSSTSEPAFSPLYFAHSDADTSSSFIAVVDDTLCRDNHRSVKSSSMEIIKSATGTLFGPTFEQVVPIHEARGVIAGPVIHLQSPTWRSTYIQAGSRKGKEKERLGIEMAWLGLHIRPLGKRPWGFEFGIVDGRGTEGIVRISSQQDVPEAERDHDPPIIHLPFALPNVGSTITPWLHLNIHLPALIPHFTKLPTRHASPPRKRSRAVTIPVPSGTFASISFITVYANCRIRRIWCSKDGEETLRALDSQSAAEFGLHAAALSDP